jgi:hypothetical protein
MTIEAMTTAINRPQRTLGPPCLIGLLAATALAQRSLGFDRRRHPTSEQRL